MSYAPAPPPPGTNAFAILGEDTVHCPALRLPPQKLEPPYPLRNLVLFWPSPPSPPARFTSPPDPATPTPPDAYTVEAVDGFPPVATIPLNVELPPFVASVPPAPITTAKFVMSAILNHFIPVDPDAPPAPEKLSPAAPPLKAPPPPPPPPVIVTLMRFVPAVGTYVDDVVIHCSPIFRPEYPLASINPRYERISFHPVPLLFGSDRFPSVVLMNILSPSSDMSIAPDGYPEISEANSESKVFSAPVLDHLPVMLPTY